MPNRPAYSTIPCPPTSCNCPRPQPKPSPQRNPPPPAAEQSVTPEYHIKKGWIDTAERTRTWVLLDPHGTKMAEITTKRAAQKIADLLNRAAGEEHQR